MLHRLYMLHRLCMLHRLYVLHRLKMLHRLLAKSWRSRATRTKTGAKKGHVHEVGHNMHIPNVRI